MWPDADTTQILLSRARLGIVPVLMTRPDATFPDLKALLGLTQGTLGVHLKKLEDEGYVAVTKEFVNRKPRTTARLTKEGRAAFLAHVQHLERIARDAEGEG